MSKPKVICYHGTDAKTASRILRKGFKPNTYFAYHLEDAIGYGGKHVFGVVFSNHRNPESWQFITKKKVLPNRIVFYRVYKVKEVVLNPLLIEEVFESNIPREDGPITRAESEMEQAGVPVKERLQRMLKLRKELQDKEF